jgi:menaquinone-dependent protoporphyrinogen oxidase
MAPHVLVVYGTSYGQTARIARRIEGELADRGFRVSVFNIDELPRTLRLDEFDGVLVGASLIIGGYQRPIRAFVRRHVATLSGMPSGFFAVSGSAGSADPAERAEARKIATAFLERVGWRPTVCASIAGAIRFTQYNVVLRQVMKRISRKEGVSTDTSHDHEYTDWSQVAQFAASFSFRVLVNPVPVTTAHA